MKQIGMMLGVCLLLAFSARAADFLDAADIKSDVVQTANKQFAGKITKETYLNTMILENGKKEPMKVPHSVIFAVYFNKADNEAWIDALKAIESKNYDEAMAELENATAGLKDVDPDAQKFFKERLDYLKGYCLYRLGNFPQAEKFLKVAATRPDATFKMEAEYYLARALEGNGDYKKASDKFNSLMVVTYPELMKGKPLGGEKWLYLAKLGLARTEVLLSAAQAGQESKVEEGAKNFATVFKEGLDKKYIDDDVRQCDVQIQACALKYLAKKDAKKFEDLVSALEKPLRDAAVANDKNGLGWMYLDRADSYFGMQASQSDAAKKAEYAEAALMDYMRVAYCYNPAPADRARSFFRIGALLEQLKGADWEQRALSSYKRASSTAYKETPTFDEAKKAREALEKTLGEKKS